MRVHQLAMRQTGAIDKTSMFDFIKYAKGKADFSVAAICRAVGVSETGYYKWLRKEQQ